MQAEAYKDECVRESLRPRKQNNLRREETKEDDARYLHQQKQRRDFLSRKCTKCTADNNELECDPKTGRDICPCCGSEFGVALFTSVGDGGRVVGRAPPDPQLNYFNELMAQWCCQEPPVPSADREAIVRTYNGGFGVGGCAASGVVYHPLLPKAVVRQIVIDAGLSPKVYVEKWRTIRIMLGAAPHPMPDPQLIEQLRKLFKQCKRAWRIVPHKDRKSLPNYNFFIRQMLLLISTEAYETHAPWWPVAGGDKLDDVKKAWESICYEVNWPIRYAMYDAGGNLKVWEQKKLFE